MLYFFIVLIGFVMDSFQSEKMGTLCLCVKRGKREDGGDSVTPGSPVWLVGSGSFN